MNIRGALSVLLNKQTQPARIEGGAPVQIRDSQGTPFQSVFNSYSPLRKDIKLYRFIREALPICNRSVEIYCNLIGEPKIVTDDKRAQAVIDDFVQNVKVNSLQERGFGNYLYQIADGAFAYGGGVGEIRLTESRSQVHSLCVRKTESLSFGKVDGEYAYTTKGNTYQDVPVPNPELINYVAFKRHEGEPAGYSIFYPMPFVAQIFTRMEKAIENSAWRQGDPIYIALVKGGEKDTPAIVSATVTNVQSAMQEVMKMKQMGKTGDVYAGVTKDGDISIKTIGADSRNMVLEVHLRTVEEQIVAGTGIPPALFGLSWAARETMVESQTDILVSELNRYREMYEATIRQDIDTHMIMERMPGVEYGIEWPAVNLQDEVRTSEARLNNAQAQQAEIMNVVQLVGMGYMTTEEANVRLVGKGAASRPPSKEWWANAIKTMLANKAAKGIFYLNE